MSQGEIYRNYKTPRIYFMMVKFGYLALENFQNDSSYAVQCPQFSFREYSKFPQNNLFLPAKDLIIEKDCVMVWLIGWVLEASAHVLLEMMDIGGYPRPCRALELRFTQLAPPGLVKQQRTERTSSPWGRRGKEEEDERFLFPSQQQGVSKLDPTSHTSLSPQLTHTPGPTRSLLRIYPKVRVNFFIYLNSKMISQTCSFPKSKF